MGTKIYGCSDDLIEFEGDFRGEVGCYGTDDNETGCLIVISDGTVLDVKYGKNGMGIWGIIPLRKGSLFKDFEFCTDEDAEIYSDIVYMEDGVKWAYMATNYQAVD